MAALAMAVSQVERLLHLSGITEINRALQHITRDRTRAPAADPVRVVVRSFKGIWLTLWVRRE
jgi:hypothetical protein